MSINIRSLVTAATLQLLLVSVVSASVSGLPDVSGDGFADIAVRADATDPNAIDIASSQDGSLVRSINFFNSSWAVNDHATLFDGNGDNTADDPAIVALASAKSTGQIKVQLRYAADGSTVRTNIGFLNSKWTAVAVGVLEDSNGDGNSADRAIAVLAKDNISGRNLVELRQVSDGSLLGKWGFFTPAWNGKAVVGYTPSGGDPTIAVLATDTVSNKSKIQRRNVSTGTKSSLFVFGSDVATTDLAVLDDLDNNGTADDPAFLTIGKKAGGNNIVRTNNAVTGAKVKDSLAIGSSWISTSVSVLPDISGNTIPEFVALSTEGSDGSLKLRDFSSNSSIDTFFFDAGSSIGLDNRPSNTTCIAPDRTSATADYQLERVFAGLGTLEQPLYMGQPPGDASRWFVGQRLGLIFSFENTPNVNATTEVLNISDRMDSPPNEGGLLGFAFAPDFANSGEAYVSYTRDDPDGIASLQSVVSRFTSADGGMTLNPASEEIILLINHPYTNHNGGGIEFGPDGYLYLGMGDGGSISDPDNNAQNTSNLLGTFIRIDVSGGGTGYSIPGGAQGNPFAGNDQCILGSGSEPCPEIFAWGVRNPFRWSFDRNTGDLWAGDVGNLMREEVSIIQRGGNYGWKVKEGFICLDPIDPHRILPNCDDAGMIDPIIDYVSNASNDPAAEGATVIGGYVYRGDDFTELQGNYIFGDSYSSNIWTIEDDGNGNINKVDLIPNTGLFIVSFAESLDGELFVVNMSGSLHQLVEDSSSGTNTIPDLLSETGCVDDTDPTQPASGLIPFTPSAPFWSDGVTKSRWLALPDGESITLDDDGDFIFPPGSVLVKNFERNNKLIETRLFMRHIDDESWAGYTYSWNAAQTDATRIIGGSIQPTEADGENWIYPSESQCLHCHTEAAKRALGPERLQLNSDIQYPSTGRNGNQLATLDAINMLSPPLGDDPANLPALPDPFGSAPLNERARAYLHSNCSGCHRPGTPLQSTMDLRYDTPLTSTNACDADSITGGNLGIPNAKLIAPGNADLSLMPIRMGLRNSKAMPPLGSLVADENGVNLINAWINSLAGCF